jgi:excisionase family DNA binding protein
MLSASDIDRDSGSSTDISMNIHCFSVKEAASVFRVSEKTVRRLIERKVLLAELVGGSWRIPRSEVCARFGCAPPTKCLVTGGVECQVSKGFRS